MKNNIPGPAVSFADILNHYTYESSKERAGDNKYFPLRPSSAGKCGRRLAYDLANYTGLRNDEGEIFEPNVTRLLDLGHSVESHLLKQFYYAFKQADSGMEIKYQQQNMSFFTLPHSGKFLEGSIDAVFVSPKWKCVVDVKSAKDSWSSYYKSKWAEKVEKFRASKYTEEIGENCFYIDNIDKFLEEDNDSSFRANVLQLNFYFNSDCGFLRKRGVTFCSLLYYSKNSSEVREVRFRPSVNLYKYVKDKFLEVDQAVCRDKKPELVEKEYTLGSFDCAFCPYAKACHGEKVDAKKEYFASWPKKSWPKDVDRLKEHDELVALHDEYKAAQDSIEKKDELEKKIIKILDKHNIRKVKFDKDAIYEVKHLKTGGVGGGPRRVLRRSKM